jgi:hypothetical protein
MLLPDNSTSIDRTINYRGTTGSPGPTGASGLTGQNGSLHLIGPDGTYHIPAAGNGSYIQQREEMKNILHRFHDKLYKILEEEDKYIKTIEDFFRIEKQAEKDPYINLNEDDLYLYILSMFYSEKSKFKFDGECNEIWVRYKTQILQIKLQKDSGTIYQNPFDSSLGFIYLGIYNGVDLGGVKYCFCSENKKTFYIIDSYYYHRAHSIVHSNKKSLLDTIMSSVSTNDYIYTNQVVSFVLSGILSDEEIECIDGVVKVSKAFLCMKSSYFLSLFTNQSFKKQESYKLEFSKNILEYYIKLSMGASSPEFDPILVDEIIRFGDFLQDKLFLTTFYSEIYKHRENFSSKTLLDIIRIYSSLGFQFYWFT